MPAARDGCGRSQGTHGGESRRPHVPVQPGDLPRARPRDRSGAPVRPGRSAPRAVLQRLRGDVERLATDRHYFARPARTLFNDIRLYFPMSRAGAGMARRRPLHGAAPTSASTRQPRPATTSTATRCSAAPRRARARRASAMPLPHNGYCPSHQHLAETEEAELALAASRVRPAAARARIASAGRAPRRRRRRDLHRRRARRRRAASSPPRRRRRRTTSREGVLAAVAAALDARRARAPATSTAFAHGMTVATNALLEGTRRAHGARRDRGLHRRRRARPPGARATSTGCAPRTRRRSSRPSGASPRPSACGPDGVLRALDATPRARSPTRSRRSSPRPSPSCLLHAYRHPEHERAIGDALARGAARRARLALARGRRHVPRVRARRDDRGRRRALPAARPRYLRRLVERAREAGPARAARSCSPAAGWPTLDARRRARRADRAQRPGRRRGGGGAARRARPASRDLLCFDMGGTSCDVCVVEGGARARDRRRARSAAGRSRCRWSTSTPSAPAAARSPGATPGGALRVGPRSAGAEPGPACYGRGGTEPTVTDANLVLGHLDADAPLAGGVELDADAARARGRRARPASSASSATTCAAGHRARRQRRDGPRAARDDRRARRRPARLRAAGLRRRRAAARRARSPRSSGSTRILVPARARRARARSASPPPTAAATRSARCSAATADVDARRATARERARRGDAEVERRLRPALPRPGVRADRRADPTPSCASAFEALHEERYGYRDPRTARSSSSPCA